MIKKEVKSCRTGRAPGQFCRGGGVKTNRQARG